MLGQCGFAAAVVPEKRHKRPSLDGQVDAVQYLQRGFIRIFIAKGDAVGDDHIHTAMSSFFGLDAAGSF